jgi:DNA primase large subunit
MSDHSTFAYVSFLAAIGLDGGEIVDRLSGHTDVDAELASYRVDHLVERDGAAYLPPSCATMQAWGDCVNRDALCSRIAHPLEYYERRLDGADPGAIEDGDRVDDQASRAESQ